MRAKAQTNTIIKYITFIVITLVIYLNKSKYQFQIANAM